MPLHEVGFVPRLPEIEVEQKEGEATRVQLHDGSYLTLRALRHGSHDVTDRAAAFRLLIEGAEAQEFLTGLIYLNESRENFVETLGMVDTPLVQLPDDVLRPPPAALSSILETI
jgi:2-oxoglutarate ferredoxin oxidoreductase subunit beta